MSKHTDQKPTAPPARPMTVREQIYQDQQTNAKRDDAALEREAQWHRDNPPKK